MYKFRRNQKMSEQIVSVEAQQKVSESTELATRYENFAITTPEVYSGAGGDLKIVKSKIKELGLDYEVESYKEAKAKAVHKKPKYKEY